MIPFIQILGKGKNVQKIHEQLKGSEEGLGATDYKEAGGKNFVDARTIMSDTDGRYTTLYLAKSFEHYKMQYIVIKL